jgi:hypothetical protein
VVISSPGITAETKVNAVIAQAAADTTALYVARPGGRSVTLYLNAADCRRGHDWYF